MTVGAEMIEVAIELSFGGVAWGLGMTVVGFKRGRDDIEAPVIS
jgi:hypothetical protein